MKRLVLLFFILPFLQAHAEVKSKYLRTQQTLPSLSSSREAKKPRVSPPAPWTAYGKLVGRVDNLLIVKTKDGKFLLREDYR